MRVAVEERSLPPEMSGAWHTDLHAGTIARLLSPRELVEAVFMRWALPELEPGQFVGTIFGYFEVLSQTREPDCSRIVLSIRGPGLLSRFAITARSSTDRVELLLHNSVHPTSWLGRAYFRAIEPFHNLAMRIGIRLIARRARRVDRDGLQRYRESSGSL